MCYRKQKEKIQREQQSKRISGEKQRQCQTESKPKETEKQNTQFNQVTV